MKLLSVILVTVFCATIVSAAPSSSSIFSFLDNFSLSKIFDGIENKLKEKLLDLQCVRTVIDKAIGDNKIVATWDETSAKLDDLIDNEWPKCLAIEDVAEQYGCKVTVAGKGLQVVSSLLKELAIQSKWGLITEIVDKISSECFKDGKFLDLNEPSLVHKAGEKIRCTIGAISEALKDTEFSPIWEETKKELEELHKRIADCKKLTSNLAVTKCIAKETAQSRLILAKFFVSLHNVNKETYKRVKKTIKEKCF